MCDPDKNNKKYALPQRPALNKKRPGTIPLLLIRGTNTNHYFTILDVQLTQLRTHRPKKRNLPLHSDFFELVES